jgi:hypothetical protein
VDAITGSMLYTRTADRAPESKDSSWVFGASGTYSLPIGGGKGVSLSRTMRLRYLPDVVSFGMDWNASRATYYTRYIQGLQDSSALRANSLARLLTLRTNGSYLPINGVTLGYSLTSRRDMLVRQTGFTGGNIGTEVDHTQTMNLTWSPRRILFLNPNFTLQGRYHEDASAGVRLQATDPFGLKNITNNGSARVTTLIPLSRFSQRFRGGGAVRDTSGGNPLTAPFRFLLSRVQDIQTTFAFDRSAFASRVVGSPGFAYTTGFTQKLDPSLQRTPNSNISQSRSYISTANTTVQPFKNLTVDVHADHRISYDDNLLGARRIHTLGWPDLSGRWLQLQQTLGMGEMLSSFVVSSHYSMKTEDQGPQGKPIETHSKATNWGPLLRWEASFRNGIRADWTTGLTKTSTLDQRQGGVIRRHSTKNHDVHLTKTYPASKGIRFPWSKRRVKLPNDVNLNLTLGIARDQQETEQPGFQIITETDTQRLNVGSGTSYNFTPSITGGFDLSFTQSKDYKLDITQRGIRIAVNGQFRF